MLAVDDTSTGIVGYSTGCDISVTCDITEITNALSGRGKAFLPGRYEWSISATGIVSTGTSNYPITFLGKLMSGTSMTAYFGLNSSNIRLSGTVYVSDWSMGAPVDGNATYNVTFKGSGALTIVQ